MEVNFAPELEAKLTRLASEQGLDPEALVLQVVERSVNYDEWFTNETEKGLAQIRRGELLAHEEVELVSTSYSLPSSAPSDASAMDRGSC